MKDDSDPASFSRPDHLHTPGNRIRLQGGCCHHASTAEKIKERDHSAHLLRDHRRRGGCVAAMNQTYVNDLKKTGSFDKAAQAKALNGAISAAIKSLSSDALDYIKGISGGDTVAI